jgi:hypothetical protein
MIDESDRAELVRLRAQVAELGFRKERDLLHKKLDERNARINDLLAALEEARPYCTKYGVYLPDGEFVNGYTAHNECPSPRHVYVVTEPRRRAAIAAIAATKEGA